MAIIVKTKHSEYIRVKIPVLINEGKVDMWEYDEDGDYTQVSPQWHNKAWLRAIIEDDNLIFYIIGRKMSLLSIEEYSFYHSRMSELIMSHFGDYIDHIIIIPPFKFEKDTKNIDLTYGSN